MTTDAIMEECDICRTKRYRKKTDPYTITPVMLPVRRYDEYGRLGTKLETARLDACETCLRNISGILSQYYEMGIYGNGHVIVN